MALMSRSSESPLERAHSMSAAIISFSVSGLPLIPRAFFSSGQEKDFVDVIQIASGHILEHAFVVAAEVTDCEFLFYGFGLFIHGR